MANDENYKLITDKIIAALENGVAPWQRPWATFAPMSMSTGKAYRGINLFMLQGDGSPGSNWWGTFKRVKEMGGIVRKGEKASQAVLWKFLKREDAAGNDVSIPMLRFYHVFSATQCDWADGMPDKFVTEAQHHDPIAEAEAIVSGYSARPSIIHGGDRACYAPSLDRVDMPDMSAFKSADTYYSTLFHELTHSTGHAKRLDRDGVTNIASFGTHTYGVEELIAEMGAAMLCGHAGITSTVDHSASYLASWLNTIKESPKMVVQAAGKAQRAADHILGVTWPSDSTSS